MPMSVTPVKPKQSRREFLRMAGIGAIGALGVSAYGDFASRSVRLERHELTLPKWDADGFRVGVISDVHVNNPFAVERARSACELLVAEKPDLIVHVGDVMDSGELRLYPGIARAFEPLHEAKCPCVGVLGNHDYWTLEVPHILEELRKTPLMVLRNETFEVGGVTVAGMDDGLVKRAAPQQIGKERLSKSLLTLLHEPDFQDMASPNSSLQLSGHSHGGQVCLPLGISLHTPVGARKYIAGFYPDAQIPLYVSRGVGMTGPQWRLFCPPEAAVLTLRGA